MMTAFIAMETQLTLAHRCAELSPQTRSMFSHQGHWAARASGPPTGPNRMGWGCWWCLEYWWFQGALLPSQTGLCIYSISLWRLSPPMICSPNHLPHLVLIVMISGLGMPWISQSNISSFILPWFCYHWFSLDSEINNSPQKPTAVFGFPPALKL